MKKKCEQLIVCFIAGLYLAPILVTIVKSFQFESKSFSCEQYLEFLLTDRTLLIYFWNSMLYSIVITVACLVISFPIGFLFAKISFLGKKIFFFFYVLVMLLPFQATVLPNYIGLRRLHLLNTRFALIMPLVFSPIAVFLFRQFMIGVRDETIESALLETSSVWHVIWRVVFPQIREAVVAVGVLIFCESWNMVDQVLIFTAQNEEIWPMSVKLNEIPSNVTYVGSVIYMYPVLVLFLIFRYSIINIVKKMKW